METEQSQFKRSGRSGIGTLPVILALIGFAGVAAGFWMMDRNATLNQSLAQSNSQVQELSKRLDALTIAQERAQASAAKSASRATKKGTTRRKPLVANDPRVDKLQGQLADTQQELARTREDVSNTRDDLNGSIAQTRDELNGSIAQTRDELAKSHQELSGQIDSTRTDLNGSIARTHDEVVELRKRGEQNVYEFHLDKAKQFEHVGPLSLALRSANPKRKTYDVAMIVEDNALTKKHVNLYEPIWIRMSDRPQAVELVVNRIETNRITGYVTEPKYKRSELTSAAEKAPEKPQQLQSRQ
jgi:uncharacterized coiled-coil protein SlyX